MKKILIGILSILTVVSAQASEWELYDTVVNENKTYFETLEDFFAEGKQPDVQKLLNVARSGRCFSKGQPNHPDASAIAVMQKKKEDVGPIANNIPQYEVIFVNNWIADVNAYDEMNFDDLIRYISEYGYSSIFRPLDLNLMEDSLKFKRYTDSSYSIKAFENYIVVKQVDDKNNKVLFMCYYYKPEYPL